jgi:GAF domain-containing protein
MSDDGRRDRYSRIAEQLAELIAKTDDPAAHRATAAALLHHKIPGVSWTGFYLLKDGQLVVDAYQGPVACLVLERNVGVCWAAIDKVETQIVSDVHGFSGHIACDERTRSEVVVPVRNASARPIGVLDIDSHREANFDEVDGEGIELIVNLLEERWNNPSSSAYQRA